MIGSKIYSLTVTSTEILQSPALYVQTRPRTQPNQLVDTFQKPSNFTGGKIVILVMKQANVLCASKYLQRSYLNRSSSNTDNTSLQTNATSNGTLSFPRPLRTGECFNQILPIGNWSVYHTTPRIWAATVATITCIKPILSK